MLPNEVRTIPMHGRATIPRPNDHPLVNHMTHRRNPVLMAKAHHMLILTIKPVIQEHSNRIMLRLHIHTRHTPLPLSKPNSSLHMTRRIPRPRPRPRPGSSHSTQHRRYITMDSPHRTRRRNKIDMIIHNSHSITVVEQEQGLTMIAHSRKLPLPVERCNKTPNNHNNNPITRPATPARGTLLHRGEHRQLHQEPELQLGPHPHTHSSPDILRATRRLRLRRVHTTIPTPPSPTRATRAGQANSTLILAQHRARMRHRVVGRQILRLYRLVVQGMVLRVQVLDIPMENPIHVRIRIRTHRHRYNSMRSRSTSGRQVPLYRVHDPRQHLRLRPLGGAVSVLGAPGQRGK